MSNKYPRYIIILACLTTLVGCRTTNKKNDDRKEERIWKDSLLIDFDYESFLQEYHKAVDTTYTISDILNTESGNILALFYAVEKKDTTFIESYLNIMDTVNFEEYHELSLNLRERLFAFDYNMHGLVLDQLNDNDKEIIRFNTMSVFWSFFYSCMLFNCEESCFDCEKNLTQNFAFYDRKYDQMELKEINNLMNRACR